MSESEPLKVGSTVWVFDANRRVYPPKKPGEIYSSGGPIYREHFVAQEIVNETSRSWVLKWSDRKLPKKRNAEHPEYFISEAEIEGQCYLNDHRYKIAQKVERIASVETLKQIAALVGYQPHLLT